MRVLLKLTLDCDADAAWRAIRSPAVLREVVAPWLDFESLEAEGFPATWPEGPHRLRALAFGITPLGEEVVDASYPGGLPPGVRMLRDGGGALTGPLAAFRSWDHRMAVSPLPASVPGRPRPFLPQVSDSPNCCNQWSAGAAGRRKRASNSSFRAERLIHQ